MIAWLESIPQDQLVSRFVLNHTAESNEARAASSAHPPERSTEAREGDDDADAGGFQRPPTSAQPSAQRGFAGERSEVYALLASLQRMEHDARARDDEKQRKKARPLIFGATPLLTDALPGSAEWLRRAVPASLLEQRDRLYMRRMSSDSMLQ